MPTPIPTLPEPERERVDSALAFLQEFFEGVIIVVETANHTAPEDGPHELHIATSLDRNKANNLLTCAVIYTRTGGRT